MKKYAVLLLTALLTGCTPLSESNIRTVSDISPDEMPTYQQEYQQLHIEQPNTDKALNSIKQTGLWLPYMHYDEYLTGKSEDEFRAAVHEMYASAKNEGINTLYLHVHPCGDAYYVSDIFPRGTLWDSSFDPLEIMLEEAHSVGLSAHAWINPLRLQTDEQMAELPDDLITKQWAENAGNSPAKLVNGRWYLDPSYPETDELLSRCIEEILSRYDVDGIHIDDYFYPTAEPDFDEAEFAASGAEDLAEWRLANCTRMVKNMYDTVKSHDSQLLFGISPQGSIAGNYTSQFADVKLWAGTPGYCDYIVPQLYFGFLNECCPFLETLSLWEEMTAPEVSLIIGLGEYKLGKPDKWAGIAGEQEWVDSPDIIERQKAAVLASSANGYALYR